MLNNTEHLSEQRLVEQFHRELTGGAGRSQKHDSADKQVSGQADYVDDKPTLPGLLHLCPVLSEHAHAHILDIDTQACLAVPGVIRVLSWQDVPGELDVGALAPGEPLFAKETVEYHGQVVLTVVAESEQAAQTGANAVNITYQPLEAVLDVEEALRRELWVEAPHIHQRGDVDTALSHAPHRIQGQFHIGGQEHFYLEGQVAMALPGEDHTLQVFSSTQHPTEVQKLVSSVLGLSMNKVTVDMRRMGGGFGGKETQAASIACHAALAAYLTERPAKLRLSRRDDMRTTGKRHPFFVRYDVGFTDDGMLHGVAIDLAANCGYALDLSGSICDRAMFHADNAYYLGDARITGYRCRTHLASNTAYRGFGGPQGMVAIEQIMDRIARELGCDPLTIRKRNYYGKAERNVTHYWQTVEDNPMPEITRQLEHSADYHARREAISVFNAASPVLKRGLALTPVKFGISFTSSFLNQAGALILIYTDGTVQLNHGGTEMGQGLNTKVAQVVADVLQIPLETIQIIATNTGKVPNTSPTAASSGADLNGKAAEIAAQTLKTRLTEMLCQLHHCDEQNVVFRNGIVQVPGKYFRFADVANLAWLNQVPLSATGFYKVPGIHYDRTAGRGQPFYYFAYGAACSEVLVDTLTGEYRLLRTDILHDVGQSLNPALDIGQIEGGFIQGAGWLTCEELVWSPDGRLLTDSPMSYKIPAISDIPPDFRVQLLENHANPQQTVYRSKAVGEPPFMLGISVWCALQDAVASVANYRHHPHLDAPATPERVFWGIQSQRETA
ncbi:xanthine dehydrogenase molybdopterin binding subunit [Pectobacterium actinidiae]|uniref:Xanthine dehydrogenase molybdopterin binding subunit n=1 Tax=Pectobacterium actinidiae TaxID=1507808 RepID=A0A1V2R8N8_9GAMM|nr:xanthine dehydrogenase molybdopterin binding subunit [Pectobacterium actinidiae]KHN90473.1 xanthine dehydrogenase, molybdopterin binding subunit [Pectobacterium actinidiae]ONK07340.1 xanthine dehydrogenase molybdopterin binding subunit [Pectobacterium actinidiae]ONK08744.1 xanthine dehydrogenase molybdopterin binding subunit [Pectobacterium actinidiae]